MEMITMWDEQCNYFGTGDEYNVGYTGEDSSRMGFDMNYNFGGMIQDNNTIGMLLLLGFTMEEMTVFNEISMFGKVTTVKLNQYGVPYIEAQRIKYMADIVDGKVSINSPDELIKHLKKMKLSNKKIGMWDLATSKIDNIPRHCFIEGLPKTSYFSMFNSGKEMRKFDVIDSTPSRITFRTDIIPKIPYGDSKKLYRLVDLQQKKHMYVDSLDKVAKSYKEDTVRFKIENVAEIVASDGKKVIVKVNRDYARVCGRFIVVASLRYPEKHLGLARIITLDGTKVYVYARQTSYSDKVKYSGSSERIYAYGESKEDISKLIIREAINVYNKVNGVYGDTEPATVDFETFESRDSNNINNGNAFEDNEKYEDEEGIASGEENNADDSSEQDW